MIAVELRVTSCGWYCCLGSTNDMELGTLWYGNWYTTGLASRESLSRLECCVWQYSVNEDGEKGGKRKTNKTELCYC